VLAVIIDIPVRPVGVLLTQHRSQRVELVRVTLALMNRTRRARVTFLALVRREAHYGTLSRAGLSRTDMKITIRHGRSAVRLRDAIDFDLGREFLYRV